MHKQDQKRDDQVAQKTPGEQEVDELLKKGDPSLQAATDPEAAAGLVENVADTGTPAVNEAAPGRSADADPVGAGGFGEAEVPNRDLHLASKDDIGGGRGLDEAEMARKQPLDGKTWNGKGQHGDPEAPHGTD